MLLWKYRWLLERKCLDPRGTWTPTFVFMPNDLAMSNILFCDTGSVGRLVSVYPSLSLSVPLSPLSSLLAHPPPPPPTTSTSTYKLHLPPHPPSPPPYSTYNFHLQLPPPPTTSTYNHLHLQPPPPPTSTSTYNLHLQPPPPPTTTTSTSNHLHLQPPPTTSTYNLHLHFHLQLHLQPPPPLPPPTPPPPWNFAVDRNDGSRWLEHNIKVYIHQQINAWTKMLKSNGAYYLPVIFVCCQLPNHGQSINCPLFSAKDIQNTDNEMPLRFLPWWH